MDGRRLLELMEGKLGESHSGELHRETAEQRANRIIAEKLARRGWQESEWATRRRSDPGKLASAARLRSETTLPIKWIAARVQIGTAKGAKSVLPHLAQSQDQRQAASALEPCAQLEFQSTVTPFRNPSVVQVIDSAPSGSRGIPGSLLSTSLDCRKAAFTARSQQAKLHLLNYTIMKNLKRLFWVCSLLGTISAAQAATITFSPTGIGTSPGGTMDGTYYYTWGINWSVPSGNQITAATLTYNNIELTSFGNNNPGILWTHLLDTSSGSGTTGVTTGTDNDNGSDAFSGQGLLVGKQSFPTLNVATTISYSLDLPTLISYAADGHFAIGIDPDCHYTDSSIVLSITYSPQSAPDAGSTVMLLGIALPVLGLFRRSK